MLLFTVFIYSSLICTVLTTLFLSEAAHLPGERPVCAGLLSGMAEKESAADGEDAPPRPADLAADTRLQGGRVTIAYDLNGMQRLRNRLAILRGER